MTSTTRPPRQSAAEDAVPACPYVGLLPFSEGDAAFFFGRENEIELIAANLVAARLTLLYAPSGVGKTSVLRAGVVPRLHLIGEEDDDLGLRCAAVAYVRDWSGRPLETVAAELRRALRRQARAWTVRHPVNRWGHGYVAFPSGPAFLSCT